MPLLTCQASDTWQVSDPLPRFLAALREKHAHSRYVEGLSQRFNEYVGLLQSHCFSLAMNMTFLRTRIVVIALMVGLAWSEGRMPGFPAGEEPGKAFDRAPGHGNGTNSPALLTLPGPAGINITLAPE
jgi:hypothetical protein